MDRHPVGELRTYLSLEMGRWGPPVLGLSEDIKVNDLCACGHTGECTRWFRGMGGEAVGLDNGARRDSFVPGRWVVSLIL
jgi:hypothetical protein